MAEKITINISKKLIEEIQQLVDKSQGEFKSVDEYIEFVLTEVLKEDTPEQIYSPEEEKEIKKRLRSLGYIE